MPSVRGWPRLGGGTQTGTSLRNHKLRHIAGQSRERKEPARGRVRMFGWPLIARPQKGPVVPAHPGLPRHVMPSHQQGRRRTPLLAHSQLIRIAISISGLWRHPCLPRPTQGWPSICSPILLGKVGKQAAAGSVTQLPVPRPSFLPDQSLLSVTQEQAPRG